MSLPLRHLTRSSLNLLLVGSLLALPACSAGTTVNSPDSPAAVAKKAELAANLTADEELVFDKGIGSWFKKKIVNPVKEAVVDPVVEAYNKVVSEYNSLKSTYNDIANDVSNIDNGIEKLEKMVNKANSSANDALDAMKKSCDYFTANVGDYRITLDGYFNYMSSCSPSKDGDGYFLFGTNAGSGTPVWQQTVYISTSDTSPRNFSIALQTGSPVSGLNISAATAAYTASDTNKFASKMFGISDTQLATWVKDLYNSVGAFAVTGSYNSKDKIFTLYINHTKSGTSLASNSTITSIKNVFSKISSDYSLQIKEGSSITHSMVTAKANFIVFFYLFGTHKAQYDML